MHLTAVLAIVVSLLCVWQICEVFSISFSKERPKFGPISPRVAFALNSDVLDWKEAFKACKDWNGTLAFPTSAFEGEMLRDFLIDTSDNSTKDIHLGFHSLFAKGIIYTTVQGRDMGEYGYGQWDPQSQNGTDQRCGAFTVDGMKTIDCDTRMESVCEFQESLYYDQIDEFGYYRFHDLTWNWTDAVFTCKIQGANLLTLRSAEEYEAVFNHFSEEGFVNGTIDILYGAHQLFADHLFLTMGDDLLEDSGYNVWAPGEPGEVTGADFPLVGLHLSNLTTPEAEAGMFVLPWGLPMQFICKKEFH